MTEGSTAVAFPDEALRQMRYRYYGILDSIAPQGTLLPSLITASLTKPSSVFRTMNEAKIRRCAVLAELIDDEP